MSSPESRGRVLSCASSVSSPISPGIRSRFGTLDSVDTHIDFYASPSLSTVVTQASAATAERASGIMSDTFEKGSTCGICHATVSKLKNPRHHCRVCRRTVCGACSPGAIPLEGLRGTHRICKQCSAACEMAPAWRSRIVDLASQLDANASMDSSKTMSTSAEMAVGQGVHVAEAIRVQQLEVEAAAGQRRLEELRAAQEQAVRICHRLESLPRVQSAVRESNENDLLGVLQKLEDLVHDVAVKFDTMASSSTPEAAGADAILVSQGAALPLKALSSSPGTSNGSDAGDARGGWQVVVGGSAQVPDGAQKKPSKTPLAKQAMDLLGDFCTCCWGDARLSSNRLVASRHHGHETTSGSSSRKGRTFTDSALDAAHETAMRK